MELALDILWEISVLSDNIEMLNSEIIFLVDITAVRSIKTGKKAILMAVDWLID